MNHIHIFAYELYDIGDRIFWKRLDKYLIGDILLAAMNHMLFILGSDRNLVGRHMNLVVL